MFDRVVARTFAAPLWVLTTLTLLAATLLHGYKPTTAMRDYVLPVVRDPWHQTIDSGFMYSSPLGPWITWLAGADTQTGVMRVSYLIGVVSVAVSVWAVNRWASLFAARLWLAAYFCSPQSWAATAYLGLWDIITVAGLTVCMVAPTGVCVAAGLVLGVNHFEQAFFGLVAIAAIRVQIRRESWRPAVAAIAGLVAGKVIVTVYLALCGIDTNGRLDFIRDEGFGRFVDGWRHDIGIVEWAVYNVLWVGVIWMLATMKRDDRNLTILLHVLLTLPVLITFDLSRVYRTVTWPIVVLLVLYAAGWPDRRMVQRAAVLLVIAACFVPRTEIWYGGYHMNG